jgi:hypothetical protein
MGFVVDGTTGEFGSAVDPARGWWASEQLASAAPGPLADLCHVVD